MCEHCGCRNNPEIGKLGAEHDAIVELADTVLAEIRAGTETMAGGVRRLQELLVPHVRGEETGIFRVAEELGLASQYVYDLEDDHRHFDSVLSEGPDLDEVKLVAVLDELYRHIAVEEYDLFPEVNRKLNPDLVESDRSVRI